MYHVTIGHGMSKVRVKWSDSLDDVRTSDKVIVLIHEGDEYTIKTVAKGGANKVVARGSVLPGR